MEIQQPAPPPQAVYPAPPQWAPPMYQQPIVINNVVHQPAAFYGYRNRRHRKQSGWVHLLLFVFTMGIGNIAYALYIESENRR
ncbi:hypothetical protein [Nocardia sp. IFM 10818]